jgi:5-formyltetrahydrofolate cyclo-ligase
VPRASDDLVNELRQRHLDARRQLSALERSVASDSINRQLLRSRQFARAQSIGVYLATYDEVDLDAFIRTAWSVGKCVYAPRVARNHEMFFLQLSPESEMVRNQFGIREPVDSVAVSPRTLDWIILPMVVFDADNNRIGMGGGYYDRALAFTQHRHNVLMPRLSGVAFACQESSHLSANPWDIGVSRVYSDKGPY